MKIVPLVCLIWAAWSFAACSQDLPVTAGYALEKDLPYYTSTENEYQRERCRLDLYYPTNIKSFPTVIWFHGGGLTAGNKSIPKALREQKIAVVAVNYRLSPKVTAPTYIEDAAAAVAWTFKNISKRGGDEQKIFVSGHSAGGYLTSMIGLDKRWLAKHEIDADSIAGLIPLSGQSITHFTIRNERGIPKTRAIIDELAPVYHVRGDAPPILLISGDREMEMVGRYEESAYFWRMLQEVKHPNATLYELQGYDHGKMAEPAFPLLLNLDSPEFSPRSWIRQNSDEYAF